MPDGPPSFIVFGKFVVGDWVGEKMAVVFPVGAWAECCVAAFGLVKVGCD